MSKISDFIKSIFSSKPTASVSPPANKSARYNKDHHVPENVMCANLNAYDFLDQDGNPVKQKDYLKMFVAGDSLEIFGIKHNDLIFVKKTNPANIEFPKTCVFMRSDYLADETNNKARYIVNKVYCVIEETCRVEDVNNVILSDIFQDLKNDPRYVDVDYIYGHLNWNFKCNGQAVLTSRLDNDGKFILEFKRLDDIIGFVEFSYSLKKER